MRTALPVVRAEAYRSEALRILRVATKTVGTYYVVTEADSLFPEDELALHGLDRELMGPWRNRVVESRFFDHPHKWFPLSEHFHVHLVHPEVRPV
jgi:hypothetical protein